MTKLPFPHEPDHGEWITFIQWKGTDACMDWYCPACGKHNHIDQDFMYEVECLDDGEGEDDPQKGCGAVFITGSEIKLYPLDVEKYKRFREL